MSSSIFVTVHWKPDLPLRHVNDLYTTLVIASSSAKERDSPCPNLAIPRFTYTLLEAQHNTFREKFTEKKINFLQILCTVL